MKRRVSLCIALMKRPNILILDKPGATLDIYGKREVISYIKRFAGEGGTVVMSTHDKDEIKMCGKLYLLENGVLHENKFL